MKRFQIFHTGSLSARLIPIISGSASSVPTVPSAARPHSDYWKNCAWSASWKWVRPRSLSKECKPTCWWFPRYKAKWSPVIAGLITSRRSQYMSKWSIAAQSISATLRVVDISTVLGSTTHLTKWSLRWVDGHGYRRISPQHNPRFAVHCVAPILRYPNLGYRRGVLFYQSQMDCAHLPLCVSYDRNSSCALAFQDVFFDDRCNCIKYTAVISFRSLRIRVDHNLTLCHFTRLPPIRTCTQTDTYRARLLSHMQTFLGCSYKALCFRLYFLCASALEMIWANISDTLEIRL